MDPLLTRKHNSYSEAFASYLACGLQPKTYPDVLVTIRRFPYEDGMIHLHRVLRKGAVSMAEVNGYVLFEFNNDSEDITMLYVSPEDQTHFAPLVGENGQLNRELVHRMIGLLGGKHGHVKTGVEGVHHWPDLRDEFLKRVYDVASS